ncbi:hypothetical protein [Escherichia coli]|uniref:hypothetical protein n=1 Tax=Escherichia coli TaxID=562 RepID=UPI0019157933|nr:hypothetical protein [Escherichia coli]GHM15824.1 hypothetical protein ECZU42_50430 [Escherichia coli]
MSARSQALVPLSTEQQAAWRAVAEHRKRRHQGNTLAEYPYGGVFPLSERKPQDIAV